MPITHGGTGRPPTPPVDLQALAGALAQALGGPPPQEAKVASADLTLLGRIDTLTYRLRHPTVPRHLLHSDHNPNPGGEDGRGMPAAELRAVLLERTTPRDARHRVWQYLAGQIHAFRGDGRGDWFLYALGLILPGLWNRAIELAPPPDTPLQTVHRVHRVLAEEFLFALDRTDPARPYIWKSCLDAATYHAKGGASARRAKRREKPAPVFVGPEVAEWAETEGRGQQTRLHRPVGGHPYMTLAELVRDTASMPVGQRLSRDDARLLAHTYIDGYTLAEAARIEGISEATARGRQWRARRLVGRLLGVGNEERDATGTEDRGAGDASTPRT